MFWRVVCLDIDLSPPNTCNNTVYTSTPYSLSKKVYCVSLLFNSVLPGYTLWTSGLVYGAVHAVGVFKMPMIVIHTSRPQYSMDIRYVQQPQYKKNAHYKHRGLVVYSENIT